MPLVGSVGRSTIGLKYLNIPRNHCQLLSIKDNPSSQREGISCGVILIGEGCDLLLGLFIICKLLLVLLPILARCARHLGRQGCPVGWFVISNK